MTDQITPISTPEQAIEAAAEALHPLWFPSDYNHKQAVKAIRALRSRIPAEEGERADFLKHQTSCAIIGPEAYCDCGYEASTPAAPTAGPDREAVARIIVGRGAFSGVAWNLALTKADAILALSKGITTNDTLPTHPAGDAIDRAREALEQIQLMSSNHGGWLESDPAVLVADIHTLSSQALSALPPAPTEGAEG